MPDTTIEQRPISRTEICMRVRGIIADALVVGPNQVRDTLYLRVSLRINLAPFIAILFSIEKAFGIQLPEARTEEFWAEGTVGELISLVEGALSGGGIRS